MPGITEKNKIADLLEEISLLMELSGENVFKVRAFSNAARLLDRDGRDLKKLIETGELEKIKGIGKGHIAGIIHDFYEKGKNKDYEDLRKKFPESLFEVFNVPGLGAKRIKVLYEKLDIKSLGELEYACNENRLSSLDGFGVKTQANILQNIAYLKKTRGHYLIDFAAVESEKVLHYLGKQKGIEKICVAGSIRRGKEIVKDIDILVTAQQPDAVHRALCDFPETQNVIAHGKTKSSVILKSGIQCDLRTVSKSEFPAALYYFTGSKDHNVAMRTRAKKKGLKINEYGLFKGKKKIECKDEKAIFETLGVAYIPPEARENNGEIEFAEKKAFPRLVELGDIRGVFHVHSDYSDGAAPLEAMIRKAAAMGLEYVGISDHSQSAFYAGGLKPDRVKKQFAEIDQLQKKFKIRIFKGIESDILSDGKLDYAEPVLQLFDFVIGSIHSGFKMSETQMTARIKKAMDSKYLTFVGHPTGRLLLGRQGYPLDMEAILTHAKKTGVAMELNANPHRLDLDWRDCRTAKQKKVGIGIHPDAHSVDGMDVLEYGVRIARKAWIEKDDVVNTLPVSKIESYLKKRK